MILIHSYCAAALAKVDIAFETLRGRITEVYTVKWEVISWKPLGRSNFGYVSSSQNSISQ